MNSYKRIGNRWTVNELLSLQREYELLGWTVQEIADKHERTVKSILYRLESEGFIDSWKDARGFDMESYTTSFEANCNSDDAYNDNNADDDDNEELSSRVWCLEVAVNDIKDMIQQLINTSSSSSSTQKKLTTRRNQLVEQH
jgi:hypothetical protein